MEYVMNAEDVIAHIKESKRDQYWKDQHIKNFLEGEKWREYYNKHPEEGKTVIKPRKEK